VLPPRFHLSCKKNKWCFPKILKKKRIAKEEVRHYRLDVPNETVQRRSIKMIFCVQVGLFMIRKEVHKM